MVPEHCVQPHIRSAILARLAWRTDSVGDVNAERHFVVVDGYQYFWRRWICRRGKMHRLSCVDVTGSNKSSCVEIRVCVERKELLVA